LTPTDLQRLLTIHAADIQSVVRRHASSEMDSDDLRQEIAIAVWKAMPRFLGQSSERTYIMRIAQNRAVTFRISQSRKQAIFHPLEGDSSAAVSRSSGEYEIDRLHGLLDQAIQRLPSAQRGMMSLVVAGYSPAQIAAHTRRSTGAVRVALHRAREAVADCSGDRLEVGVVRVGELQRPDGVLWCPASVMVWRWS
jgi:RNA polymerase sigma-70 factor (ECF subfamily)